ncbi:hypothetical protein Sjap_001333 [Stephania japonica]|uniref:SKP1 component dimerisation domain-containing protein n=1 Tax=Stephania japonica TaxID=461633 RepID=A0AAP0KJR4_9MAGN
MIEDTNPDSAIPVTNATGKILAKGIEYCKKHVETPKADDHAVEEELKNWDATRVRQEMIKGRTSEEIRKTFNIKNAFTPEEEEELRREN